MCIARNKQSAPACEHWLSNCNLAVWDSKLEINQVTQIVISNCTPTFWADILISPAWPAKKNRKFSFSILSGANIFQTRCKRLSDFPFNPLCCLWSSPIFCNALTQFLDQSQQHFCWTKCICVCLIIIYSPFLKKRNSHFAC